MMVQLWAGVAMGPDMEIVSPQTGEELGVTLQPIERFVTRTFARA